MTAKSYLKRYLNDVIYSLAFSEGITVTFFETERILNGKDVDIISTHDYGIIISLKRAWQYVYENLGTSFYYEDIESLNAIVSGKDFKRGCPDTIRNVEEKICEYNQIDDPLEKGLTFFAYFTRSQIFNNCNKRTAFLLANKVFLENDLGILYPTANKIDDEKYKVELVEFYKTQDTRELFKLLLENNFHNYKLDSIRKDSHSETVQLETVLQVINEMTIENNSSKKSDVNKER